MQAYVGVGIYSVPEASRLTGVSGTRIRRWLRGYAYSSGGEDRVSAPLWRHQLPEIDGRLGLGFLDLMETRVVDAFLKTGVSWRTIRRAAGRACKLFGTTHPLCTGAFRTDGKTIFAEFMHEKGERVLVDLVEQQYAFHKVLAPYLRSVVFDKDKQPTQWHPFKKSRRIVIDPLRSFGQPIVDQCGIPTITLADAVAAEGSVDVVCRWFHVGRAAVRDAVAFEKSLAA